MQNQYGMQISDGQKANYSKKTYQSQPLLISSLFVNEICWWYLPKNIELQKMLLKKICQENKIFLKQTNCQGFRGSQMGMITIDGYEHIGANLKMGLDKLIKIFDPIVLANSFRMKEITVYSRYGCYNYDFGDFECIICLDTKNTRSKQNCCGRSICQKCLVPGKDCFYCRQEPLIRDYLSTEQFKYWKQHIRAIEKSINKIGHLM